MRKPSHLMVIAAGSLLLAACAPRLIPTSTQEANDAQIAKETLLRFLSDLHEGDTKRPRRNTAALTTP